MLTAKIVDISDLSTALATCHATSERGGGPVLNDVGGFSIAFQNDDPDLTAVVTPNRLVTFSDDGTDIFTGIFEQAVAKIVDPGGADKQITTWTGRGHVALLDRHLIYPALALGARPIEEDRGFNWQAAIYDWVGHGAIAATTIDTVANAQAGSLGGEFWDPDFADPAAEILGPSSGNTSTAPIGACFYHQTATISTLGTYEVQALMDNYGEVYWDGALLLSPGQDGPGSEGFVTMTTARIELSAGLHEFGARTYNLGGPTGFALCVVEVNADGSLGAVVGTTAVGFGALVIEYPAEEPGMTPGEAILVAVDEAKTGTALGNIAGTDRADGDPLAAINLIDFSSFDAVNDSDGQPWPSTMLIGTKIGTSLLTFLRELAAAGYIDFAMTPGTLELKVWIGGTRGTVTGVDFHPVTDPDDESSGNLTELTETREA